MPSLRPLFTKKRDLQPPGLLPGAVGACEDCESAVPLHPVLCQRTPSGCSIRGFVLYRAGVVPRSTRAGHTPAQVPLQDQIAQPGLDHHLALLHDVPLGPHQRERPPHPDLDSLDHPAPVEMAALPLQGQQTRDLHPDSPLESLQNTYFRQVTVQVCPVLDSSDLT